MLDKYIIGDVNRISPESPVPIVEKRKEEYRAGGAANVALNLTMLGAKVTLMTSVAEDENGKKILDILDAHGVKIIMGNMSHTIVKTRVVAHSQQIVRIDEEKEKSFYGFRLNEMNNAHIEQLIDTNDVILLSDYNKGVLTQELVDLVAKTSKIKGKFLTLDPKPSNKIKFDNFDLITPNRKEANELLEKAGLEIDELVARLDERHKTRILALTLSEDGLALSENGEKAKLYPCISQEVVDVCGAGDVCCAILSLTLANKANMDEAALLSNLACGIAVGKFGTVAVSQKEIIDFWKKTLGQ